MLLTAPAQRCCCIRPDSLTAGTPMHESVRISRPAWLSFDPATTRLRVAACLGHMAFAEAWREGFEAAAALSEDAIRFAETSADDDALALTVSALIPARYEDAAPRASIAMTHLRATGDLHGLTRLCVNIGYMALAERRYRDAIDWLDDGLEAAGRLEDPYLLLSLRTNLGIDVYQRTRAHLASELGLAVKSREVV